MNVQGLSNDVESSTPRDLQNPPPATRSTAQDPILDVGSESEGGYDTTSDEGGNDIVPAGTKRLRSELGEVNELEPGGREDEQMVPKQQAAISDDGRLATRAASQDDSTNAEDNHRAGNGSRDASGPRQRANEGKGRSQGSEVSTMDNAKNHASPGLMASGSSSSYKSRNHDASRPEEISESANSSMPAPKIRTTTPAASPDRAAASGRMGLQQSSIRNRRSQTDTRSVLDRRHPEFVVPRWQPDSEVTACPICRTGFSWLNRKHHCRKCGRVVCSSCSPHRITIPYPYIVQPPSIACSQDNSAGYSRFSDPTGEGHTPNTLEFGGGERVRLCNPCVPDPNITPPQTRTDETPHQGQHGRSFSSSFITSPTAQSPSSSAVGAGDERVTLQEILQSHSRAPSSSRRNTNNETDRRAELASQDWYLQNNQNSRQRGSTVSGSERDTSGENMETMRQALRGMRMGSLGPRSSEINKRTVQSRPNVQAPPPLSQRSSSSRVHRRSSTAPRPPPPSDRNPAATEPRPPLRDEADLCPVCGIVLPVAAGLSEAHITACITSHTAGPSSQSLPRVGDAPGPSTRARKADILHYKATIKDCEKDAECQICLEEFEVGLPMGRLTCWCTFHLDCIETWFEREDGVNRGKCPEHG